jgi:translation initiation factor 2 subunit 2
MTTPPPPLLGEFIPPPQKKRPHIRTEVMERARLGTSETALYSYQEMLQQLIDQSSQKGDSRSNRALIIPPPAVSRKGKKTTFANFTVICEKLKRTQDHVKQYICSEESMEASIDGEGALILSGRVTVNVIERLIRAYVSTYVKCAVCGSKETQLEKNNRLLFLKCSSCTASRSVTQITQGFKANTTKRTRRKPA